MPDPNPTDRPALGMAPKVVPILPGDTDGLYRVTSAEIIVGDCVTVRILHDGGVFLFRPNPDHVKPPPGKKRSFADIGSDREQENITSRQVFVVDGVAVDLAGSFRNWIDRPSDVDSSGYGIAWAGNRWA